MPVKVVTQWGSTSYETWACVFVVGAVAGLARHVLTNGGGIRRGSRSKERIDLGWAADIFISMVAAAAEVLLLVGSGYASAFQVIWISLAAGLSGPALLETLIKDKWQDGKKGIAL